MTAKPGDLFDRPMMASLFGRTRAEPMEHVGGDLFDQEAAFVRHWEEIKQTRVQTERGRLQAPAPHHRVKAWREYRKSVRSPQQDAECWHSRANYRKSDRVKRGYVQDAGTWFGRWREWLDDAPQTSRDAAPTSSELYEFHRERVETFLAGVGDPDRSVSARAAFNEWAGALGDGAIFADGACGSARDFWDRWKELASQ